MSKRKIMIRSIITLLIFWYSPLFQWIPIKLLNINTHNISGVSNIILSVFSSIILVFIYFFLYRKDLKKEFKIFQKKKLENIDIGFKYWIIGLIIMMASNYIIRFLFHGHGAGNEQAVQNMIKISPLLMLIDGGIIGPFTEEIAFRKTIKDIIPNKWIFALLSFLLFGGAHVITKINVWTDILYIIPYGSLGAAFALSYHETDTVFTSMIIHMIHNTILILLSIILFSV